MELHPRAWRKLRRHVEREWPREAGGMISDGGFWELPNLHPDPERHWSFDPSVDMAAAEALVHSHPDGCAWPSRLDMESQIAAGIPFGIVPVTSSYPEGPCRGRYEDPHGLVRTRGVAGEPFWWPDGDRPYVGRPFRFGVTDCLQLVRDWRRRELAMEIPPFAYGWDELDGGGVDLFRVGLAELGWRTVAPASARVGDVVLLGEGARATHCGVLVEGGMLLHHPSRLPVDPTALSRRTPISRLQRHVVEVVRP